MKGLFETVRRMHENEMEVEGESLPPVDPKKQEITPELIASLVEANPAIAEVDQAEFEKGLAVEMEHVDTVGGDMNIVAQIVLDHMKEFEGKSYYDALDQMEHELKETPEEEAAEHELGGEEAGGETPAGEEPPLGEAKKKRTFVSTVKKVRKKRTMKEDVSLPIVPAAGGLEPDRSDVTTGSLPPLPEITVPEILNILEELDGNGIVWEDESEIVSKLTEMGFKGGEGLLKDEDDISEGSGYKCPGGCKGKLREMTPEDTGDPDKIIANYLICDECGGEVDVDDLDEKKKKKEGKAFVSSVKKTKAENEKK